MKTITITDNKISEEIYMEYYDNENEGVMVTDQLDEFVDWVKRITEEWAKNLVGSNWYQFIESLKGLDTFNEVMDICNSYFKNLCGNEVYLLQLI